jgi:hypothetical protein
VPSYQFNKVNSARNLPRQQDPAPYRFPAQTHAPVIPLDPHYRNGQENHLCQYQNPQALITNFIGKVDTHQEVKAMAVEGKLASQLD